MSAAPHRGPELLSPAGTLRNMRYALAYGADAVYAGLPRYSLRVRNNDFDLRHLQIGIAEAHAEGRRFYLAANLMPHGAKLRTFIDDMEPIVAMGPDALIMADPGLILMVRERWPDLPIHLSVQANTVNAAAVHFWQRQGLTRVILSRELSLEEIAAIRDACPDIELEVFVHGALCIAYSGRCLLSGYFNHRDANQGSCTNACRWAYRLGAHQGGAETFSERRVDAISVSQGTGDHAAEAAPTTPCYRIEGDFQTTSEIDASPGPQLESPSLARHPAADEVYLLEEAQRPGEYMPIFEDENGTYILNSRDLQAVEHVGRLSAMGIDCLKIEGRTKSHYYAARTAQVYRAAIEDALAGRAFRAELKNDLEGLANRGYTEGFYRRHAPSELQGYEDGVSRNQRRIFVGDVIASASGWAEIDVKNRFAVGDALELMSPAGNRCFRLEAMVDLEGEARTVAPGAGWRVRIPVPLDAGPMGLLTRALI